MNTEKVVGYGLLGLVAWIGFQAITRYNNFGTGVGDAVHALFGGGIGENLGNAFWNAGAWSFTKTETGPAGVPFNTTNNLQKWNEKYAVGYAPVSVIIKGVAPINVNKTDVVFGRYGFNTAQIEWAQMHYGNRWTLAWPKIVRGEALTPEEQAMVNSIPSVDF